ncbi:DnaB-like helicase C-terminal domain-containing protein [Pseudanabaena sp. 'Roaring Creek']|uniref:replicative DNA helicase n=1 Tax=Pseudanabaena sp. 'Roaring Creek' TaxID=1681830 RepID=UPI0006D7E9B5|nr:DnaB-like helicase C-terminal domain-containing protein [Pseudanabaena sp. 'Roaring Creek']
MTQEFTILRGSCPICNGERKDCRSSGEDLIHCYSNYEPPLGYVRKGTNSIGASLYSPAKDETYSNKVQAIRTAKSSKAPVLSMEERDRKIRSYEPKLTISQQEDLLRRGLTNPEINLAKAKHWLFALDGGYGITAIDPITGLLCGAQKALDDRSTVKYTWGVFTGDNHLHETDENPLFIWVSPKFNNSSPYEIKYCEGALKSMIRGFFEWRTNPQVIMVGGAGGIFGTRSLSRLHSKYSIATAHTLLCDANTQDRKKGNILTAYKNLATNLPSVKFADWGQWQDKSIGDCDEQFGTESFNGYQLRSPSDWLSFFEEMPQQESTNLIPINASSIPPQDLDAEIFCIGQFLIDASRINAVLGIHVSPEHFYRPLNREICQVCLELSRELEPVDILSVHQRLSRKGLGDKISKEDLKTYRDRAEAFADNDLVFQAKVIKEKYILRTGQSVGRELIKLFTDESKDLKNLTAIAQQKFLEFLTLQTSGNQFKTFGSVLEEYVAEVEAEKLANPELVLKKTLGTGVPEIDSIGEPAENSIVSIYGRPSHGKTTLTFQWAQNIALEQPDKSVLYFSLEVSKEEAAIKHATMNTGLPSDSIRYHDFGADGDRILFNKVVTAYRKTKLYVYDALESVEQMCQRVRTFIIENGPVSAIFIDYLQLMYPERRSFDDTKDVNECLRQLKRLRKELKISIFILVQTNRDLEKRQDKRPTLSDAKQSGNIEQDSDEVIYVYRDEMYNSNSPNTGMIEIGKLKSRNGKMGGVVKVPFDGKNSRIGNGFISLLDRLAIPSDTISTQLQILPDQQTLSIPKNVGGAIPEPEIANEDFF